MACPQAVRSVVDPRKLASLERQIDAAEASFIDVGHALDKLRRLFLDGKTFEAHCARVWGWGRSTVYERIQAASIANEVRNLGQTPRSREVALALAACGDTKSRRAAWKDALETYGDRPTAAQVAKVVEKATGRPPDALPGERSAEFVEELMGQLTLAMPEGMEALDEAAAEAAASGRQRDEDEPDQEQRFWQALADAIGKAQRRLQRAEAQPVPVELLTWLKQGAAILDRLIGERPRAA